MLNRIPLCLLALIVPAWSMAQETPDQPEQPPAETREQPPVETAEQASDKAPEDAPAEGAAPADSAGDEGPRTMSGMSILGNEEAPKALVIVPWKTSELGANLSLADSLDDRARPVDREVFMRELDYYDLRSGE